MDFLHYRLLNKINLQHDVLSAIILKILRIADVNLNFLTLFSFSYIPLGGDVKQKKGATNILIGMDNGALSSLTVLPDGTHTHQWTIEDPIKRSQITCTSY